MRRRNGEMLEAADLFAAMALDAQMRGANWLAAQAVLGLVSCRDPRADEAWRSLKARLPARRRVVRPEDLSIGNPRVLWMVTI